MRRARGGQQAAPARARVDGTPHRPTKSDPNLLPRPRLPIDLPVPPHPTPASTSIPPTPQVQRDDVFARAHADAFAPSFIDAPAASSDLDASLPPFPTDSACGAAASTVDDGDVAQLLETSRNASLASAAAEAAAKEERAYVDACAAALAAVERVATSPATASGRRWPPPPPSEDHDVAIGKQTSALAARLQQMFSHVRELERARAIGRHDLHAAQTRGAGRRRGRGGRTRPELSGTVDVTPSGSYEVRLVRDDDARGAHLRAMRRTLAANVAANDAIGLSDTFWAWMESVLALEEREELEGGGDAGGGDGDAARIGRPGGGSGARPGAPSLARALRDVQANVKTVADALRERRRDIERAAKAWDAEKASVAARAGTAAGMAAAERRRSGSPDGDAGGSSADAVERASSRASEELNARAAKAASALPGLAQIKDAVAAADAERAAAADAGDSDECGVLGGGGTRVASEEFPPGVAERLVARGASFDGAFFDGASPSSSRRRRGRPSRIAGSEAATDALERLLPVLEDSERALDAVRSRSRGILKDAVDRRFGRDRLVSTHGWE